jgi:hypothetical protein
MVRGTQPPDAITHSNTQIVILTGQAMSSHITNSKSGDMPNTHFIAVGLGIGWHFAFNMDSIISHVKSNRRTEADMQGYIYIYI